MIRTMAALAIFCLCVSIAFSATATPTSQSTAVSPSSLNSTYDKILSGANTTEYTSTTWGAVGEGYVYFGAGAANTTSYVYGIVWPSNVITKVIRRSINATIAGSSTDTTEAAVIGDTSISTNIPASGIVLNSGPGYLAILTTGTATGTGTHYPQVQVTIISPSGALTTTAITSNTDSTANYNLGSIFYEMDSGVFFVSYSVGVGSSSTVYSLYVQGVTASTATVYWTSPLSITLVTTAHKPQYIFTGGDNYTNASNIYVAFKDSTGGITYYSKTTKANSTSSAGSATVLATDVTLGVIYPHKIFYPIGVWASDYTYGIACGLINTASSSAAATVSIQNFLNGSASTTADSGLTNVSSSLPVVLIGWKLTTGYTLLAAWTPDSGTGATFVYGSFYANGTANMTATTLASALQGPINTYEDGNGTQWIGWTDVDTTNYVVYNLYLAKLQGQLNPAASLETVMAFVALCLVAVFTL